MDCKGDTVDVRLLFFCFYFGIDSRSTFRDITGITGKSIVSYVRTAMSRSKKKCRQIVFY